MSQEDKLPVHASVSHDTRYFRSAFSSPTTGEDSFRRRTENKDVFVRASTWQVVPWRIVDLDVKRLGL